MCEIKPDFARAEVAIDAKTEGRLQYNRLYMCVCALRYSQRKLNKRLVERRKGRRRQLELKSNVLNSPEHSWNIFRNTENG